MNARAPKNGREWTRPSPAATGPDRSPLGLYRAPDGHKGSALFSEDAVANAVRSAHEIADAQIKRGMDAARRLREASVRNGLGEPAEVLGRTEQLVRDTLTLALEWVTLMAGGSAQPLQRLLSPDSAREVLLDLLSGRVAAEVPARRRPSGRETAPAERTAEPAAAGAPAAREAADDAGFRFLIALEGKGPHLPVLKWRGHGRIPDVSGEVRFGSRAQPGEHIKADFAVEDGHPGVLHINLEGAYAAGVWRATVQTSDGLLSGYLELELG